MGTQAHWFKSRHYSVATDRDEIKKTRYGDTITDLKADAFSDPEVVEVNIWRRYAHREDELVGRFVRTPDGKVRRVLS